MKKSMVVLLVIFSFLTACSNDAPNEEAQDNEEEVVEDESSEDIPVEATESLVEPTGIMEEWNSYSPEEKSEKINECLAYLTKKQEENGSPIEVIGTPEQFVAVIDERYVEIQGLTGENGYEKIRMNDSPIIEQVGIMGQERNLIEFAY